jgi:hypothetical protein
MISKGELKAAYAAARWAVACGRVMSADDHDTICPQGDGCSRHACVISVFARSLFEDDDLAGFPSPSEMEELFDEQGLHPLASSSFRVITLNDNGQFGDALAELSYAVRKC